MIDTKPHSDYKNSGVDWLGNVPEHWEVRRLKYLLYERDTRSTDGSEQLLRVSQYTGVTERRSKNSTDAPDTRAASLVGYKCVSPNELVVNIMLAWNGSMGVSYFSGIASPAYCVYQFRSSAIPWYFHNLLRSPSYKARIKAVSTGVVESRLRLYTDDLYRLEGLLPPLPEQTAIVRYLDYVDRRVRRFVRAKEKLIGLLDEQKQVIIHRVVTRGLDPDVPLKSSGVEWLGEVPEHWEVRRLKHISRLLYGNSLASEGRHDGTVPIYGSNGQIGFHSFANTNAPCIIVGRKGSFGKINYCTDPVFAIDTTFFIDDRATFTDLRWLFYLLGWLRLDDISKDSAVPGLDRGDAYKRIAVIPPRPEQTAIVKYLDKATADIDTAITRANREVELLNEYRTRLIADVVTGKLDVREAAAQLPDETGEPELPDENDAPTGSEADGGEDD